MDKLCKIRDVQRSIIAFEQRFVKRYGICLNEGMLLCSLQKSERLSSGELGELLGLTPSNTSKVIASVEEKGLITRILGTADKRQMYFSLTEEGRRRIASICCEEVEIPELLNEITAS
ncbi:winged helix DNA-binding protein [Tannerella sp.]|uniref:winged helix DNA-binding protein n=1 Tax=Tannerella sp. TaxID=2382127 RepID=UPI0026DBCBE0|nr:winged helix DNA-binding protein [Tannerella sp.]MDO4704547.1 MarR family transcriptional regulator [Tannerella sp.]